MHGVLKKFLEYLEYKNIGTVVSRRKYLRHFDVDFYRKYYQDLRKFTTNPEYERHFLQNGRLEGRFANSDEMILALVEEFGPLPDDFIADEYRAVNDDLKTISERYPLEAHYLRFGRREGRAYLYARTPTASTNEAAGRCPHAPIPSVNFFACTGSHPSFGYPISISASSFC